MYMYKKQGFSSLKIVKLHDRVISLREKFGAASKIYMFMDMITFTFLL